MGKANVSQSALPNRTTAKSRKCHPERSEGSLLRQGPSATFSDHSRRNPRTGELGACGPWPASTPNGDYESPVIELPMAVAVKPEGGRERCASGSSDDGNGHTHGERNRSTNAAREWWHTKCVLLNPLWMLDGQQTCRCQNDENDWRVVQTEARIKGRGNQPIPGIFLLL